MKTSSVGLVSLFVLGCYSISLVAADCSETCTVDANCTVGACYGGECLIDHRLKEGDDCGDYLTCDYGLWCDSGTCEVQADVSAACSSDDECIGTSVCINSVCRLPRYPGDVCLSSEPDACVLGGGCEDGVCRGQSYDENCCMGAGCASQLPCGRGLYCYQGNDTSGGVCRSQILAGESCSANEPDAANMCAGMADCNKVDGVATCTTYGSLPSGAKANVNAPYTCADNTVLRSDDTGGSGYRCKALNVAGVTDCRNDHTVGFAQPVSPCSRFGECSCNGDDEYKCDMVVTRGVACGEKAALYRHCMNVNKCFKQSYLSNEYSDGLGADMCHGNCWNELSEWNCCLLSGEDITRFGYITCDTEATEEEASGAGGLLPSTGVAVSTAAAVVVAVAAST